MARAHIYVVALLATAVGCGGDPGVQALFELPRAGDTPSGFYALPFPNDLRLSADGTVDLDEHVRPNDLIDLYLDTISDTTRGFGTNSAGFVRFSGTIDPDSLPADPEASRAEGASVQLVDVDPASPEYGQRRPLLFRFSPYEGESIGDNWLGCLPFPGFPLRPDTTYALIITDRVRAEGGGSLGRSPDMEALLGAGSDDSTVVAARAVYAPLLDWLDEPGGDERDDVISAAVFTTQDPVGLLGRARQVIQRDVAAPALSDLTNTNQPGAFHVFEARYDAPNFQTGEPPYRRPEDGGAILTDESGDPIVQRTESLRVAISVPEGAMPSGGWPIVIYAHGTGGDYRTFVENGTAARFAGEGLAVVGIDQPLHGARAPPGTSPDENTVFNYNNPIASLDVIRQGAIDDFQLVRLVESMVIPDAVSGVGDISFDADRISFMGHSQGGITGALFVPFEPAITGAVLSGAGGLLYQTMLHKDGVTDLVAAFIRDWPLDQFNNLLALVQMFGEPADPANYGPLIVREPPPGSSPKHIYQSEGFVDSFTPPITIEALGVAIGASPVTPTVTEVPGFGLRGLETLDPPVTGNASGTTAVFVQYEAAPGRDGHFVAFDVAAARRQHVEFLSSLARDGAATLVP